MYKIVCIDLSITELYVGHTTDFRARKNKHKSRCNNINDKNYNLNIYKFIRENGNWDNWNMIKIEDYPCLTRLDATKRERELYESLNACLNSCIPSRTKKEYSVEYNEYFKIYHEEWRRNNKKNITEKAKEYYENNKKVIAEKANIKVKCECGGCFTTGNKSKHLKTKKHILYIESLK
jgi:hypothetical protein